MTDDRLDLSHVAADDDAIELLRLHGRHPDDSALQLLRDLLVDLDADPQPRLVPVGRGSTGLRLAAHSTPDPRVKRGGTVVALLAAGMVVFGGVAAASTAVTPDNPLHGFGESVRAAAGAVVDAVRPPDTARRADPAEESLPDAAAPRAGEALASRPAVPSGQVAPEAAAVARSDAAARQVDAFLTAAAELLEQGRAAAADQRLDLAERRLADVRADAAGVLLVRLDELRGQAAAAAGATRTGPPPAGPASKAESKPESRPESRPEPRSEAPVPAPIRSKAAAARQPMKPAPRR